MTYWTQYVHVYNNTAPHNVTVISNQSFIAGYALSFSFPSNVFVDTDGGIAFTYSYASSPSASAWLSLDSATRTFSGTPTINTHAYNYSVTVYAQDANIYSAHGSTSFYMNIIPNEIPELDQGLHTVPVNVSVYFPFTYTVPADAFKDQEGDAYTIRHGLIPNNFTTTYNSVTRVVSGTQTDNTKFGNYIVRFYVEDIWNVSSFTADLNIVIYENLSPQVSIAPTSPA
jgi:hypothetical protein